MLNAIKLILMLRSFIKATRASGARALAAENATLRQQLILQRRKQKRSPKLTTSERVL